MNMLSEQVNELRGYCIELEKYGGWWNNRLSRKIKEAADTIESLSEKLQAANMENGGEWILCEDRLPPQPKKNPIFDGKPLELYLVSVKNTDYAFRAFWNGKFFADGFSKLQNVEAWQPLPEPYRP